jgi:hypothetical protein
MQERAAKKQGDFSENVLAKEQALEKKRLDEINNYVAKEAKKQKEMAEKEAMKRSMQTQNMLETVQG